MNGSLGGGQTKRQKYKVHLLPIEGQGKTPN
jgi:hypothetical protein